jgi:hypothetical protein
MKKAVDYVIVSGIGLSGLQSNCQEFLTRDYAVGWSPIGAPFYHPIEKQHDWHQAFQAFRQDAKPSA